MKKLYFFKIIMIFSLCFLYQGGNNLRAQGTALWSGDTVSGASTWINSSEINGAGIFYAISNTEASTTATSYLKPSNTWTNTITNDPDNGKIYPRLGFSGTYPGQTAAGWPAYRTTEMPDVWFQYSVTPTGSADIHIQKISFSLFGLGTGTMRANAYVSTDPTFATRTLIEANIAISPSVFTDIVVNGKDYVVTSGQKLYLRIYPWYGNNTNASTSKYIVVKNVKFETFKPVDVTDSKLTDIFTNGSRIVGFLPTTTTYNIELNYGTTQAPPLTAVQKEPGATVSVTNALSVPGSATILVTGVDGISKTTYTINFIQAAAAPQIAFPGAEGYGKYTQGGRGGVVYEVTNLNDSGPGSFRAAVEASGPRTVVFRVSGTIVLNSNINITNPYITIAGQTAPGDGICLRKYTLTLDGTKQAIIRYIRVRLGNESGGESDAVSGRGASNIILDHVSASWSVDETFSIYSSNNITVQWSIIAESLFNSNHPKGTHGFGGIAGSDNSTYHHNLVAHHSSRNFRMSSGAGYFDFRNNAIYNWGYNSTYGGENYGDDTHTFTRINLVGNYYKPGPATQTGNMTYRIANPSYRTETSDYGKWYIADNVMVGNTAVTTDNWNGGVQPQGGAGDYQYLKLNSPWVSMPINQQTATEAYSSVLDNVGATLPKRDAVDDHVINDTRNGNATYEGPTYETVKSVPDKNKNCGIIDLPDNVGGWPILKSITAPTDTDHDGMPDTWELAKGLDPDNASDGNLHGTDGYTNLENYLNSIEFNYPVTDYSLDKQNETTFKLSWADNYIAETGFKVERSYDNNPFVEIASLPTYSNTYTDSTVDPAAGGRVNYRVIAFNTDNSSPNTTTVSYNLLGINENNFNIANINYYPNPFSDEITIDFPLSETQKIRIELFDMNGKKVATIADRIFDAGLNKVVWNVKNSGNYLNTGMYILTFKSENSSIKREMKLLKK